MVMRVDVVDAALEAAYGERAVGRAHDRPHPGGRRFDEELAVELAGEPHLALLCGRYEGFDERVVEHLATDAVSIGRYVLSGGELAAMVVADAVLRKLPGRWATRRAPSRSPSARRSRERPSTRTTPGRRTYRGWGVPEILLSGDHAKVRDWRRERSRERRARAH